MFIQYETQKLKPSVWIYNHLEKILDTGHIVRND